MRKWQVAGALCSHTPTTTWHVPWRARRATQALNAVAPQRIDGSPAACPCMQPQGVKVCRVAWSLLALRRPEMGHVQQGCKAGARRASFAERVAFSSRQGARAPARLPHRGLRRRSPPARRRPRRPGGCNMPRSARPRRARRPSPSGRPRALRLAPRRTAPRCARSRAPARSRLARLAARAARSCPAWLHAALVQSDSLVCK